MLNINQALMNNNRVSADNSESLSRADISKNKIDDEKTRFLKIFIAQIQNQIPTEPMENKEMSQLTAVFSQVEQQVETNKNLEKLVKFHENLNLGSPISYLGTEISTDSSYANLARGEANFSYNLPEECREVLIKIKDSKGKICSTEQGSVNAGFNHFVWNGKNEYGAKFPDGEYKIDIEAYRANKENIKQSNNQFRLENSKANFDYILTDEFDNPELAIKDYANKIIYQTNVKSESGNNSFIWNGRNNDDEIVSNGDYIFEIKGKKLEKSNILSSNFILKNEPIDFKYNIANEVRDAIISIKDENMHEVFKAKIDKNIGENNFIWNGKDSFNNSLEEEKKYNIEITTIKNPTIINNRIKADTISKGLVTSVDTTTTNPTLTINGMQIAINKVKSVSLA